MTITATNFGTEFMDLHILQSSVVGRPGALELRFDCIAVIGDWGCFGIFISGTRNNYN
jgi:hypothetical protein